MQAVQDYALNTGDATVHMTYCGEPKTPPGESRAGEVPVRTAMVTVQVTAVAIPGFPSLHDRDPDRYR